MIGGEIKTAGEKKSVFFRLCVSQSRAKFTEGYDMNRPPENHIRVSAEELQSLVTEVGLSVPW